MTKLQQAIYDYYDKTRKVVGFVRNKRLQDIAVQSVLENKIANQIIDMALKLGILNQESVMLDMGCGLGGMLVSAKEKGIKNIYGIDIDKDAVKISADRIGEKDRVFWVNGEDEMDYLPKFDLITSIQTIEHTKNPAAYLKEARRLLKPNGSLLLMCPNYLFPWEGHYKLPYLPYLLPYTKSIFKAIVSLLGMDSSLIDEVHFDTTPKKINRILYEAGFKEIQDYSVNRFMERINNPELIDDLPVRKIAIPISKILKLFNFVKLIKWGIGTFKMYYPIILVAK